jgi:hypothetical protein
MPMALTLRSSIPAGLFLGAIKDPDFSTAACLAYRWLADY